jgi:hypothetical protein
MNELIDDETKRMKGLLNVTMDDDLKSQQGYIYSCRYRPLA